MSVAIRLRLGKIRIRRRKSSAFWHLVSLLRQRPVPSGRRLLVAVSVGVNRSFQTFSGRSPEAPGPRRKSRRSELWSRSSVCVATPSVDARVMSISNRKSGTYVPFSRFDLPAPSGRRLSMRAPDRSQSGSWKMFPGACDRLAAAVAPSRAARLPRHMG
jgi:hypothetical protein